MCKGLSLYVHIPFCAKKCQYCDFNSYDNCNGLVEEYFDVLIDEIDKSRERFSFDVKPIVDTIFFGGGTPSFPHYRYIEEVMKCIRRNFMLSSDCEITIETNPGTVTEESLVAYKNAGFNRLSIGLQSTNDNLLSTLGRIHDFNDFVYEITTAKKIGFDNINVDIMFGLPGQSVRDLIETLEKVTLYHPTHISCYSLIVEEGTPFYRMFERGELDLPTDEIDREMYHSAISFLRENGYEQYEISNFSKDGYRCLHNEKCWKYYDYLGFGASACSFISQKRITNIYDIKEYINENSKVLDDEEISDDVAHNEFFMLGLRLLEGVDLYDFNNRFGVDAKQLFSDKISKLKKDELICEYDGYIRLTEKGLDFANLAFMEFV